MTPWSRDLATSLSLTLLSLTKVCGILASNRYRCTVSHEVMIYYTKGSKYLRLRVLPGCLLVVDWS